MSTQHDTSSERIPQTIIPVRPVTDAMTAPEAAISAGLLRRTLGGRFPSRRTLGGKFPTRRTLGGHFPSRRTLGGRLPSQRTFS